MSDLMQALVKLIRLERLEDNLFRGESRDIVGSRVFGGQVLGQALLAASHTVEGRLAHSLQAYFLWPGDALAPIIYNVERVRDGGSFTTRRVVAIQHGRTIFDLAASFQVPEEGLEHQSEMPDVPAPEQLPTEEELTLAFIEREQPSVRMREALLRPQPIEVRPVDPDPHPIAPSKRPPVKSVWLRSSGPLPDEPSLHQALLAYGSDHGLLGAALRPHGLSFMRRSLHAASLDHAMWFHRRFRLDEWLLYSMDSPSSSGARGFARGQIFTRDGRLVASVAQEGLIRQRNK
jgi:acyl-CoA thioesterase II